MNNANMPEWAIGIATSVIDNIMEVTARTNTDIDNRAAGLAMAIMAEYGLYSPNATVPLEFLPPWIKETFPYLAGYLITFLRKAAEDTATVIDDAAVDILEGILRKAGLI